MIYWKDARRQWIIAWGKEGKNGWSLRRVMMMLTIHTFFMQWLIMKANSKLMNERCGSNQRNIWSLQRKLEMQSIVVFYEYDVVVHAASIKEDTFVITVNDKVENMTNEYSDTSHVWLQSISRNKTKSEDIRNLSQKLEIRSKVIGHIYDLILKAANIKEDTLLTIYAITEECIISRIMENVIEMISLVKKDIYRDYSQRNWTGEEQVVVVDEYRDELWMIRQQTTDRKQEISAKAIKEKSELKKCGLLKMIKIESECEKIDNMKNGMLLSIEVPEGYSDITQRKLEETCLKRHRSTTPILRKPLEIQLFKRERSIG